MRHDRTLRIRTLALLPILAAALVTGCATSKKPETGAAKAPAPKAPDPDAGIVLAYLEPADGFESYEATIERVNELHVMGRGRGSEIEKVIGFTIVPANPDDGIEGLAVTIDSMDLTIKLPPREMPRVVTEILGRTFTLATSPKRNQLTIVGAGEILYDMGPVPQQNIGTDFRGLLPDLADGPVRVGDTWASSLTYTDDVYGGEATVSLEAVHTVSGFVKFGGMDCAEIKTVITGAVVGSATFSSQSMSAIDGAIAGSGLWHFAHEEGIVVDRTATWTSSSTISAGPGGMPVVVKDDWSVRLRLLTR